MGAAARLAGALLRGGGRPEKGYGGLPDSVWIAVGCKRASAARVVHWGTQGGGAGLRAWSSTARAVRWQRSSPGLAWSGPYGAPWANTSSAKKGWRGLGCLPRFGPGGGVTQVAPAARFGSGRGWSFAVRAALGSSGLGSPRIKVPRCCRSGTRSGRA